MLQAATAPESKQEDVRALGLLMVRLMEIDTSLKAPRSLELQNPELWNTRTKDFMARTAHSALKELEKVIRRSSLMILADVLGRIPGNVAGH